MDDWLKDIMCMGESVTSSQHVVANEVSQYLHSTPMDPELTLLLWWKKNQQFFPHLSILARKYLAIPASSVPSERVFSLAGNLVSKKRARTSPSNVDMFIFYRKNMSLYW